MMQLTIDDAVAAGEAGMARVLAKAQSLAPEFSIRAQAAVLAHLAVVGECCGEALTDIARARGATCHDARAMGPIFKTLASRGLIQCLRSDLPRVRGHGTSGGKLWGITSAGRALAQETRE